MEIRRKLAKWLYPEVFEDYEALQEEYGELYTAHINLLEEYMKLEKENDQLLKAYNDTRDRLQECKMALIEAQANSIGIPKIDVEPAGTVTIGELKGLLRKEGFKDIEVADAEYYILKERDMDSIVRYAHALYDRVVRYTKQVFDCDDFAELSHMLVALGVYRAGWKKQVAYGEAWSNLHAFNVAIVLGDDGNKKVVFYEPQTGEKVTSRKGAYLPKEAFFTT